MVNNKGHVLAFDDSPIMENSAIDSKAYNKIIDSLKSSTLRCINRSRDLVSKVTKFNKALSAENSNLISMYNQLNFNYSNLTDKQVLLTGYDTPTNELNISSSSLSGNKFISNTSKWSKVVRYKDNYGRDRASKDISIAFGPTGSVVAQPVNSDIYSILDGYRDTFWLADVTDKATYTLQIQFPTSLKPYVNYLSLVSFPAFGFTIDSVYVTTAKNELVLLNDVVSSELGIVDVQFKPISWGGIIQINMTATNDVIGISDLDIGLADYNTADESYIVYDLGLTNEAVASITNINVNDFKLLGEVNIPYNEYLTITSYIKSTGVWDDTDGKEISKDVLSINDTSKGVHTLDKNAGEHLFLKLTLKKYLGQTPIFRSIKITYN